MYTLREQNVLTYGNILLYYSVEIAVTSQLEQHCKSNIGCVFSIHTL